MRIEVNLLAMSGFISRHSETLYDFKALAFIAEFTQNTA